jgi:hypothetical protein
MISHSKMKDAYDLIGDLHGEAEKLRALLDRLGYRERKGAYRHPKGRRAIFLGDFIDRGPEVRETLRLVRGMIDAGAALAVMGNHDYNAIGYHTPDGRGGWLRPRNENNRRMHRVTLEAFEDHDKEWRGWIEWLKTLPLFLDLGSLRVVHACWHPRAIKVLGGSNRFSPDLLREKNPKCSARARAANLLLKGLELPLPGGSSYLRRGIPHHDFRAAWWANPRGKTCRELALPAMPEIPDRPPREEDLGRFPGYPADAPLCFVGHYGYPKPPAPMAPNVACVDFAVAGGGTLGAYRWDGERRIDPRKFVLLPGPSPLEWRPSKS